MKTVRARHKDGLVVARVVMKPYAQLNLDVYVKRLLGKSIMQVFGMLHYANRIVDERRLLADVPNALAYHRIIETGVGGFLVRQYIHSSLYDRLR